jgi:hypothetical protein
MKRIFTSICLGLALIFTASAQDRHQNDANTTTVHRGNARASSQTAAPLTPTRRVTQPMTTTHRNFSTAPFRQRAETPRTNANVTVRTNARTRERNAQVTNRNRVQSNVAVNRQRNLRTERERTFATNRERNLATNRQRNLANNRNRSVGFNQRSNIAINRNRNVAVTNNWRGAQFRGRQYAAFRDYHRQWHDRDWWRHHFNRVIFVTGFGWWYWDAGYWFPAWGYDPYAYYPYDGPIYGYANLGPGQVVSDVQAQLQADGYYDGPVDGVLGPMTRQAIAAYQADNGLAITSTVDEPTVASLGIA